MCHIFTLTDKAVTVLQLFLLIHVHLSIIKCTIDLNLAELEYIANHLEEEECRRLVAALHFKSYEEPLALDQAERKVSKDIPCIRLLLHWNSGVGEGKGETHEAIEHRLRQMGKYELADWLGKTVFHQLGQDLERSINDPFKDTANDTEKKHKYIFVPTLMPPVENQDPTEWLPFDTICWILVIGLSFVTLGVLARVVCMLTFKKRKKRFSNRQHYSELDNDASDESEDKFDIRVRDEAALKLMGVDHPT